MSLSLGLRKNIRDANAKLLENIEKIKEATGVEFTVEVDFAAVLALMGDSDWKDRLGDLFYDSYLSALTYNIIHFVKMPLLHEAFAEALGAKKQIRFLVQKEKIKGKDWSYSETRDVDGVLLCVIPIDKFASNVDNLGSELLETLAGNGPLRLAQRKNIAENNEKLQEHLAELKEHTGIDFDVEVDWPEVAKLVATQGDWKDRIGETFYNYYMGALSSSFRYFCQKSELYKEAVQEMLSEKKTIRFNVAAKMKLRTDYAYSQCDLKDGVLVCSLPLDKLNSNVDSLGSDLDIALAGTGPLTLNQRKNIADNNEKLQSNLEELKTSTGLDFEVEIDWPAMAKEASKDWADRIGEVWYNYYLSALTNNIRRLCNDELAKEAFVEKVGAKKLIRFAVVPKVKESYAYSECQFLDDGTLLGKVPKDRLCSNVDDMGSDLEKLL